MYREGTHEAHQLVQHAHVLLEIEIQCSPQTVAKVLGVGLNLSTQVSTIDTMTT